jgi:histone H3/H4
LLIRFIAKALQEIKRYQKSTQLLIPKAPFTRLVKEIMVDVGAQGFRIQPMALEALQESAEALLVAEFESKLFVLIILIFILIRF